MWPGGIEQVGKTEGVNETGEVDKVGDIENATAVTNTSEQVSTTTAQETLEECVADLAELLGVDTTLKTGEDRITRLGRLSHELREWIEQGHGLVPLVKVKGAIMMACLGHGIPIFYIDPVESQTQHATRLLAAFTKAQEHLEDRYFDELRKTDFSAELVGDDMRLSVGRASDLFELRENITY